MAEFGELGFDGRVDDTDGGPVVKELAGRGMLGDGFERGAGIVVDGLVLELTDGAAAQKSLDCSLVTMVLLSHGRRRTPRWITSQ